MIQLYMPFPPSVNQITAVVHGRKITSKRGREYRKQAVLAIKEQCRVEKLSGRLAVEITLMPPCRRKRDIDNYSKGILDAITAAGVWQDDEQIDEMRIVRGSVTKGGLCDVRITQIGGENAD